MWNISYATKDGEIIKKKASIGSYEILWHQMTTTLSELNKHFVKNKSMSEKEFMDIQLNVWLATKKKYGLTFSRDKK